MEFKEVEYRGAITKHINIYGIKGCVTDNDRKILNGTLSVGKLIQADKFKPEFQLQLFSKDDFIIEKRSNNGWNRIEMFIPEDKIDEMIEALTKLKEEK